MASRRLSEADKKQREDDLLIYGVTAIIVFLAALGVSGGTHLLMILTRNPLIRQHKATLEFRSAIIGDGVILPAVSVLMMRAMRAWGTRPGRRSVGAALLAGALFTTLVHIAQGKNKMVNWTMPEPWKWNWLGVYHMFYMASQFAFTTFYWQEAWRAWQGGKLAGEHKRDLALVMAGLIGIAVLVQTDYQE
jgi:hypothetical protein